MVKDGMSFFQGLKHSEVSILSFDIETNGVTLDKDSQVVLISNTYRDAKGQVTRKLFSYDEHENQQEMISEWCAWVREINPSIMCGHNCFGFDLNYLEHCSGNGMQLGRDGSNLRFEDYESKYRKDGSQFIHYNKAKVYGRTILDTMFLAIKYDVARKYESYGLKAIIKHEGLEKLDRVFYDAATIRNHYRNAEEMKKIKAYAEHDADDALALYDLMIPSYFYAAQSIPKTFQDVMLGATGSWINSILNRAYMQDRHSLPKATNLDGIRVEGGISFAVPGIYRNMYKVDLKSAYPSQVLRFKLYDKEKDPEAYFYKMVKYFTEQRFEYKKKFKETGDRYWQDLDSSSKTFVNSAYGTLNTSGLNFNSPDIASKITAETRSVIDLALMWASGKNKDYWIAEFRNKTGKSDDETEETL
jgi:DNA polymerase I